MTLIEDTRIIALLHQNDETRKEAFHEIVRHFSQPLYWQIRHMVLSHEDANYLLQDVFVKAWLNVGSFRGNSKISSWLYKIAVNEIITFLNRRNGNVTASIDDSGLNMAELFHSDELYNGDQAETLLQKAILSLPQKQRLVFNMRYFEKIKYEDMSEILVTSVGALKSSYHLARKKIEEYLNTID